MQRPPQIMTLQDITTALETYRYHTHSQGQTFRACFFDMDGVLYDSMPAHSRSWQETARAFGLCMTEDDVYRFEGQTGKRTINLLYQAAYGRNATEEEVKAVYEHKTKLFGQYNSGALIPNVGKVVEAFASLKRVIVTGSSQTSLLGRIEEAFPGAFSADTMITGRDVQHGKPDPEPYLMAQRLAGVQATESIVIENAPRGVRSASTAGCFTIAVNTGPLADDVLWAEGAHLVLPDMAALLQALSILMPKM